MGSSPGSAGPPLHFPGQLSQSCRQHHWFTSRSHFLILIAPPALCASGGQASVTPLDALGHLITGGHLKSDVVLSGTADRSGSGGIEAAPTLAHCRVIHPTEEPTAPGDIKSQAAQIPIPTRKATWDRYPDILGGWSIRFLRVLDHGFPEVPQAWLELFTVNHHCPTKPHKILNMRPSSLL